MVSLSIIIPTYNNLHLLKRCISSIEKQLEPCDEIIIIDDSSQDGTFDYLNINYNDRQNFLIKKQKNSGSGVGRNNGVSASDKEFIWFIDSDDYIEDASIQKVKELLGKGNYDLLFLDYKIKTKSDMKEYRLKLNTLTSNEYLLTQHYPWNKIIKRDLMKDIYFPTKKIRFEDNATIPIVIAKANKIGYIEESLYIYDFSHSANVSKNHKKIDDMYTACDYLTEYFKEGVLDYEEFEILLIKSLLFYKLFDQPNRRFNEITKDLNKIKCYLDLNAPNWKKSKYLTIRNRNKIAHLINNINLKIVIVNIFKKSTLLTSISISLLMKIKNKAANQ